MMMRGDVAREKGRGSREEGWQGRGDQGRIKTMAISTAPMIHWKCWFALSPVCLP